MSKSYHEIKVLLTLPKSDFILGPPAYLVTTAASEGQEHGVCGFLMKYYALGALYHVLPESRRAGTLSLKQQTRWAIELALAFIRILSVSGQFYSNFRMDNVVLKTNSDGSESAMLIDFEQSRNIYNWAPPEIYYLEWLAELGYEEFDWSGSVDNRTREKYSRLLERFLSQRQYPLPPHKPLKVYDNAPHGWCFPWLVSTPQEKEASEVCLLGKALYCLFEGVSDPGIILRDRAALP